MNKRAHLMLIIAAQTIIIVVLGLYSLHPELFPAIPPLRDGSMPWAP